MTAPHPMFEPFESLEPRQLLASGPVGGLTPQQVRHAYGFDRVSLKMGYRYVAGDGSGQTIAIVSAYHAPTAAKDLQIFDKQFGISDIDYTGKLALQVATPFGVPRVNGEWSVETEMDVEWAHAIAPRAHILLVEAHSDNIDDLVAGVNWARYQKGVVAVAMSWGGYETPGQVRQDSIFTTPKDHIGGFNLKGGVTFIASAGDDQAGTCWPASAPGVLSIGGTTLSVDARGNYLGEVAWSDSGGGYSQIEHSNVPSVAYAADPNVGFAVYDSTPDQGYVGWQVLGGTSAGVPQWAAMVAIVDQGRNYRSLGSLVGVSTVRNIFAAPSSDFHDIVSGSNGNPALPGYDLVTGRGSPFADKLILDLVNA